MLLFCWGFDNIPYIEFVWVVVVCPGRKVSLELDPGSVQLWQFRTWSRFQKLAESGLVQILQNKEIWTSPDLIFGVENTFSELVQI